MGHVGKKHLICAIILLCLFGCSNKMENKVRFNLGDNPYSADPLEYDYFIHHRIFRSVLGSLVSIYQKGEIVPFLASEWNHSDNKSKWSFKIRDNLFFENGDPITADLVAKSFCRMAFLQKKKKSNSGLLEHLIGFDRIESISKCEGIEVFDKSIIFKFTKKIDNLLESISFGQYGVVHPKDYDENGEWKDKKSVTSSSFYKVEKWINDSLLLKKRNDFNLEIGHKRKFSEILVTWDSSQNADIYTATSLDNIPTGYNYIGGAISNIAFLRISSWKKSKFILHNKESRIKLRNSFYSALAAMGFNYTTSFFPLGIEGIKELNLDNIELSSNKEFLKLKFAPFRDAPGKLGDILIAAAKENHLEIVDPSSEEKFKTLNPDAENYVADILAMGTGILIDRPYDDVKYMFLSKEGIRLPDDSGEIISLLGEPHLDLQKINSLIFKQGLIWPITHFSDGILFKANVDVSLLNSIHPPIDFAFVGNK